MACGDTGLIHIGPQLPLGITFGIERHGCLELIGILWQSNAVSKSTKSREHILKAKEIPDMVFRLSCRLDTISINRMKYQRKLGLPRFGRHGFGQRMLLM